jgi:hypothetical protein
VRPAALVPQALAAPIRPPCALAAPAAWDAFLVQGMCFRRTAAGRKSSRPRAPNRPPIRPQALPPRHLRARRRRPLRCLAKKVPARPGHRSPLLPPPPPPAPPPQRRQRGAARAARASRDRRRGAGCSWAAGRGDAGRAAAGWVATGSGNQPAKPAHVRARTGMAC